MPGHQDHRGQGDERQETKRCANRAAQVLRLAAAALRSSKSALGAYYRRLRARMDKGKAVTAAAHKLARLIYAMLSKGEEYTDAGQYYFEERYRQRVLQPHRSGQEAWHADRSGRSTRLKTPWQINYLVGVS